MIGNQPSGSEDKRLNFMITGRFGRKRKHKSLTRGQKFGCPFNLYIPVRFILRFDATIYSTISFYDLVLILRFASTICFYDLILQFDSTI